MNSNPNPYTGHKASGFRFCLHVTSIAHRPLFLPLEMKQLPQIQRLWQGESPLSVFNRADIKSARQAFCEFRMQFDFAYWAAKEYYIRDQNDADRIIPLELNNIQHYLIDILQKRYFYRLPGRYIISKTFGRVGISTCVQAYILWLQTYKNPKHSYTCCPSEIAINPLKTNLCRYLHRDIVPADKFIYLPKSDRKAFFNTYRNPNFTRGIDLGYVHFADMSRWNDSDADLSSRTYATAISGVLNHYKTLIVLEGNIPKEDNFRIEEYRQFYLTFDIRIGQLAHLSKNPFFLDHVALANTPSSQPSPSQSFLMHINLDHIFTRSKRIRIPFPSTKSTPC